MITLTFYGGIREIGGNKILLEDGGLLFLDIWMLYHLSVAFSNLFRAARCWLAFQPLALTSLFAFRLTYSGLLVNILFKFA